jgi:ATP-binding cassette subfamily B protein
MVGPGVEPGKLLLLLGIAGLKLLGVVIDVIRTRSTQRCRRRPIRSAGIRRRVVGVADCHGAGVGDRGAGAVRAALTYAYNMITARLTQGEIVPTLRAQLYAKLQRLSFSFFDVHGSNSIFNRVTGDVQNTRLFVDGVLLQGVNMILTLAPMRFSCGGFSRR